MAQDIDATLKERGGNYGRFYDQASVSYNIKSAYSASKNYDNLEPDMYEALHMIAVKIARILTGNPNVHDSWHDISGYAKLVADRLEDGTKV